MSKASLREFRELDFLLKKISRSPQQKNKLFESDCEIIQSGSSFLAVSVDSISEEIFQKLYRDPFLWGWMSVMISASDLAASGTQALGILLSTEWKFGTSGAIKKKYFKGVEAALKATDLKLIGGDSGSSPEYFFSSTVLGQAPKIPLMRKGVRPGDLVCLVGQRQLGAGPALALRYLFDEPQKYFLEKYYRPRPQPSLTFKLRALARASIDTSDGLANALHIISEINQIGFSLNFEKRAMHPEALSFCTKAKIHPLMLWMSDHGDFQCLLFVPPQNITKLKKLTQEVVILGQAIKGPKRLEVAYEGSLIDLPIGLLQKVGRSLSSIRSGNQKMRKYFSQL